MGSTKLSRFPASLWPGSPVPDIDVLRARYELAPDGELIESGAAFEPDRPLEPEVALRELRRLDLGDDAAIVDFLNAQGGVLNRSDPGTAATLAQVRSALGTARSLVEYWLNCVDGAPTIDAWTYAVMSGGLPHEPDPDEVGLFSPEWAWTSNLNEGLEQIHVRVELETPIGTTSRPGGDLYTGLCVQIYNLVAEGVTPRTCEDETCRNRFVRQRGGAKAGQYRLTGVSYCTPTCARRQGQRKRRATMRRMRV